MASRKLGEGWPAWALSTLAVPAGAQDVREAPQLEAADADEASEVQPQVYTPADFAQYAPRNAFDMLQQVPGFTIQEGGQGRGFGEASGNVLLNGERISTKSDSLVQRLSRVAAASVVRIELVDGAALDVPGLSGRVANIVTGGPAAMGGQFEWTPQLATDYAKLRWAAARASLTGTRGPVSYTLAAENNPFHGGTGGPNLITFGNGLVEERFSRTQSVSHNPKLSAQVRLEASAGWVANLSAAYQWTWQDAMEDEVVLAPPGVPSQLEEIRTHDEGHNYELGGDLELAVGPGRLKLIALEAYREVDFSTQSVIDPAPGLPARGSRFTQSSQSGERIGRAEYRWKMLGADWQVSAEAAFNRLNSVASLAQLSPVGDFVPIAFPAGTGAVTEDRYESILSVGRPLTPRLSLQIGAGGEYSTISQTGANARSRTFKRPKGSLTLAWAAAKGLDVSFKASRRVGQLNFGDFLADVNLQDDNARAGNNELRPQQSWEFELEAARDFGAWGSLTVSLFDNRISDLVTVVPLPGGGEAIGNLDRARTYGALVNGTLRLDPAGFRGAKVDVEAQFRQSILIDPVTGSTREYVFQPRNVNVDFRHDVPGSDWAWGGSIRVSDFNRYYRTAEFGYDYNLREQLRLFVEHKNVFGLTVQARLNNILKSDVVLDRIVYAGLRGRSPVLFRENRRREVGRIVNFTVKGDF